MKKKADDIKEIKEKIKWFSKFPLEKRLELAFREMKAIKILRSLTPKKYATAHRTA